MTLSYHCLNAHAVNNHEVSPGGHRATASSQPMRAESYGVRDTFGRVAEGGGRDVVFFATRENYQLYRPA